MSGTLKTSDMLKSVVARLLAYTDGTNAIATLTGSRVYVTQAPDNVTFPCVVVRKINTQSSPDFDNLRQQFDLEAMVYGRPRSAEQTAELIADLVEEALLSWIEASPTLGLTFARSSQRDTLPPPPDPFDREVVAVRVLIGCVSWPRYITANA